MTPSTDPSNSLTRALLSTGDKRRSDSVLRSKSVLTATRCRPAGVADPVAISERYDVGVDELQFSDDELTALALSADPDRGLDADAIPVNEYLGRFAEEGPTSGLLPDWYMAPVRASRIRRAPQLVVLFLIATFVLIEAFGLCSTYGQPPFH
jgi:hypothetical protein